eukprot:g47426.t1
MTFTLYQLQEKCREMNLPQYLAFFDLTKAIDTINQEALWSVLLCFDGTMKFVTILRSLHDDMEVVVMTNSSTTDPFPVRTSVEQGCIIAPTLFSIHLAAMFHLTTKKVPAGVELTYRTSGKLFNFRHLQSKTKVIPISVIERSSSHNHETPSDIGLTLHEKC